MSALGRCIRVSPETFGAKYWSRHPLLSVGETLPGGFDDLLTLDAVDELLSRRGLRTPFLRVAKDGRVVPGAAFTGSGGAGAEVGDQVLDERLLGLFADGSTLVLQGLHRTWPPLVDFAAGLAAELGHPVGVNAYVTPAQSQGFAAHYDVHDVFVLQVAGSKRWLVHEPVLPAPLPSQPWTSNRAAVQAASRGVPVLDVVLRPGDALYLPRGYLHAATALGQVTAHLAVGIRPLTRHALVEELCALAAGDPELRRSLPLGFDPGDAGRLGAELTATVDALAARLREAGPDDVAGPLRRRLWTAVRPEPVAVLAQAAAASAVGPDSRVRLRRNLRPSLRPVGERMILEVADRQLDLPGQTGPALGALLAGEPVTVAALPGLTPADAAVLVARLLREAIVVPAGQ